MTPEKRVQNKILQYLMSLEKRGYPVWHQRREAIGLSYRKGLPDVYAVINGQHLEIEVKAPGKELRPMQEKQKEILLKAKSMYICCDSFDDFIKFIKDNFCICESL